jgi:hypothetical protein
MYDAALYHLLATNTKGIFQEETVISVVVDEGELFLLV